MIISRDDSVPLRGDVTGAALEAWTLLAALARAEAVGGAPRSPSFG
jgi:hypothetical protein